MELIVSGLEMSNITEMAGLARPDVTEMFGLGSLNIIEMSWFFSSIQLSYVQPLSVEHLSYA